MYSGAQWPLCILPNSHLYNHVEGDPSHDRAPKPSLATIATRFRLLTADLDAHLTYKQFATKPTHDGGPHAEYDNGVYAYVVTERGEELERRETVDPDEFLYWFVSHVAVEVAQEYELKHRRPGIDSRRLWFQRHVEILSRFSSEWGQWKQSEYDAVFRRHPFEDRA